MDAVLDRHVKKLTGLAVLGTLTVVVLAIVFAEGREEWVLAIVGGLVLAAQGPLAFRVLRAVERERMPIGRRLAIAEERVRRLRAECGLPEAGRSEPE